MIIISEKEAKGKACPFVIGACEGKNCMAWIPLDDGVGNSASSWPLRID